MDDSIRKGAWWLLTAGLVWQSVAGAAALSRRFWQSRDVPLTTRITATTDDRLGRGLGADLAIVQGLRAVARTGEWVLCRVVFTPEALAEHTGLVARLTRLRHALFPWPLVTNGGDDPIVAAEAALPAGQSVLLLVQGDEVAPVGRAGWQCVRRETAFQVWRLERP